MICLTGKTTVILFMSISFCHQTTVISSCQILNCSFSYIPIFYFSYSNITQQSLTKYQQVETLSTHAHPKGLDRHKSTYLKERGGRESSFLRKLRSFLLLWEEGEECNRSPANPRFTASRRSRHPQGCQKPHTDHREQQFGSKVPGIVSAHSRVQLGSFLQSTHDGGLGIVVRFLATAGLYSVILWRRCKQSP